MSERYGDNSLSFYEISIQQYTVPLVKDINDYSLSNTSVYSMSMPYILSFRQVAGQPLIIDSNSFYNQNKKI